MCPSSDEVVRHAIGLAEQSPKRAARMERHIGDCLRCRKKVADLRSALATMAASAAETSPEVMDWAWGVLREAAEREARGDAPKGGQ